MGFLHLGWDVATKEDGDSTIVAEETPAWAAVARKVDLNKPGLSIVRQTMAWQPLHMAAMSGDVDLIEELVQVHVSDAMQRPFFNALQFAALVPHLKPALPENDSASCRSTSATCSRAAPIPGRRCTTLPLITKSATA